MRALAVLALLVGGPGLLVASAHEGHALSDLERAATAPGALSPFDLAALGLLVLAAVLYARGLRRLRRMGASVPRGETWAMVAGLVTMAVAILPPLDGLALLRFHAHMVQHELMMLVGAPLLMAGRPLPVLLHGLGARLRPVAARALQARGTSGAWALLTTPVVAWTLHGLAIWGWHLPVFYDAAVGNEALHALQHACFVGTSVLFWWGMLHGRYGRAGYGAAVFFVFTTAVHTGILGAILTFAGVPLYPAYLAPAARLGIDPLGDQQVAGLLMWVAAGFVFTLLGLGLFAAWLGESARRTRARVTSLARRVPMALIAAGVALTLSACAPGADARMAEQLTGGDTARGKAALTRYGCDTCHTIPGVLTADATVGPPLSRLAMRTYLAGRLENTPGNLVRWIREPRRVDPQTAMPDTGVTERDGRDIAAYLYTLR